MRGAHNTLSLMLSTLVLKAISYHTLCNVARTIFPQITAHGYRYLTCQYQFL